MSRSFRLSLTFLAVPLTMALSSCGDGLTQTPSTPSTGSTATPTPTPAATATPAATPTPTATPSGNFFCSLPARPDCGNSGCCSEGGPALFDAVIDEAQADLERTRPDIFNSNGSLKLDELEYTDLLASRINALNGGRVCARGGGRNGESFSKDEVAIKAVSDANAVSQNVDVIIGSSHTPYRGGRYTCRPASF